jgi:hypothetical protein
MESHERVCAERYQNINTTLSDLKQDGKDQRKLLWGILLSFAGTIAAALLAVLLHALRLA